MLYSVVSAARSGPLISLLFYFRTWNGAIYLFFPRLPLPSTGWNQNCPPGLQTWGCWQMVHLLFCALGLQSRESRTQLHHWQEWWPARVSRLNLLNGCVFLAIQLTHFLSDGSLGYVRNCTYFSRVTFSCAVRRTTYNWLEWVLTSRAAWIESWNLKQVLVDKFEKWELMRAVPTDECPECYLLQQPCFCDIVRDFRVRCLNFLEELILGLCSLNVTCCMNDCS